MKARFYKLTISANKWSSNDVMFIRFFNKSISIQAWPPESIDLFLQSIV